MSRCQSPTGLPRPPQTNHERDPSLTSDESYFADAFDSNLASDILFIDAEEHLTSTMGFESKGNVCELQSGLISQSEDPIARNNVSLNLSQANSGTTLKEEIGSALHSEQCETRDGTTKMEDCNLESKGDNVVTASPCFILQSLAQSPSSSLAAKLHRENPTGDTTCRVCNEMFRRPRILPCLHTFCTTCITNLQTYPFNMPEDKLHVNKRPAAGEDTTTSHRPSSNSGQHSTDTSSTFTYSRSTSSCKNREQTSGTKTEGRRVVLCPVCLKETSVSKTLEELPRNSVAERRVSQQMLAQEGVVRLECDLCAEHSDSSIVTVRCVDCGENLCSHCELSHRRQKKTKRHQLVDFMAAYSSGQLDSILAKQNSNTDKSASHERGQNHVTSKVSAPRQISCSRHPEEELKLFCKSCNRLVCRDCVVMDHREHKCQFLCEELFRGQMREVQHMIRSVVPRVSWTDQQLKAVSDTQEQIQLRAESVVGEINDYMDTYLSAIQQHRQQLLQQVRRVVDEKQHSLHVTERHLRQVRDDVMHTCRFVTDMIENASDVEILSVKRLITERLRGLKELTSGQQPLVNCYMRFSPSEKGQVIHNFQMFGRVFSRKASAADSTVHSEGLSTARVAHESSVVLCVNSEDGTQYDENDVQIKARLISQNQSVRSLVIPVHVNLQKNGTYCLKFMPVQHGAHFLHITVDSLPVKDSPLKFRVKAQWREHKGLWHCCTMCSSGGRLDVPCGCRGATPGGLSLGCCHGEPGHPEGHHWSCCGKMVKNSECSGPPPRRKSPIRQFTI